MDINAACYNVARTKIRDGDLLLFRRRHGLVGKLAVPGSHLFLRRMLIGAIKKAEPETVISGNMVPGNRLRLGV